MENVFISWDSASESNAKQVSVHFFNQLTRSIAERMASYNSSSLYQFNELDFGFWYNETVSKTFITPALNDLCGGLFLQELGVSRKIAGEHSKQTTGRVDYWSSYKDSVFIIEVKQEFTNCKKLVNEDELKITPYAYAMEIFDEASAQTKKLHDHKNLHYNKHLVGLPLLISPIFFNIKEEELKYEDILKLFNDQKSQESLLKSFNCDIASAWISKDYIENPALRTDKQIFPGVLFLARIHVFSKAHTK